MQWRMVRLTARSVAFDHKTADAAITYAIQKGWLIGKDYFDDEPMISSNPSRSPGTPSASLAAAT
jgi:hypothetical protein